MAVELCAMYSKAFDPVSSHTHTHTYTHTHTHIHIHTHTHRNAGLVKQCPAPEKSIQDV